MITKSRNKSQKRGEKKNELHTAQPIATEIAPAEATPSEEIITAPRPEEKPRYVGCAECHAVVAVSELFKCNHCGRRGCDQCGYDSKAEKCPYCGALIK